MKTGFEGRTLLIATMHGKEAAIAPPLEAALGVRCILPSGFDTDRFGTYSGEIERPGNAIETMRMKCLAGMDAAGADLGIASEGSFGPHPYIPFAVAGEERLICIDRLQGLEIAVQHITPKTNFSGTEVGSHDELLAFARRVDFPSHGLLLKGMQFGKPAVLKGIRDENALLAGFDTLSSESERIEVQTDMRAMCNPTRMEAIALATEMLLKKLLSRCPECRMQGFGDHHYRAGLPCAWCGTPTGRVLALETTCTYCGFREEHWFPHGQREADPGDCPQCNP